MSKKAVFSLSGKYKDYDKDASLLDFIWKKAEESKANPAIIDEEGIIYYEELREKVAAFKKQLLLLGVKEKSVVALLIYPSKNLIVLLLAILEIGACYATIDPLYPSRRIDFILRDCNPDCLITTLELKENVLKNVASDAFRVETLEDMAFSYGQINKIPEKSPTFPRGEDPAYIVYTSGSTGNPKGIVVPHRAANNHMLWMAEEFGLTSEDRFLLKTPLTFDPSVWEIFLPLFLGATLVVAKQGTHTDLKKLVEYVENYKISVLQLVPNVLHRLLIQTEIKQNQSLRYVFVGGESLMPATKALFSEIMTCELINLYGPAEATIDTTFYRVPKPEKNVAQNCIGKPIYNTTIYILNEEMKPVHEGQAGELFIAGDGLAIGYLNKPLLTESRFPTNPFSSTQEKMYKTGDIVKLTEGALEFCGRADNQMKVNGVRIETNSLKDIILQADLVYDCFFEKEKNALYQNEILVCYLVSKNAKENLKLENIKNELGHHFPAYMLPKKYYIIDRVCLSANGKIDFSQFKKEKGLEVKQEESGVKQTLFSLWGKVLNTNHLDENTNFLEVGGDSITSYILLHEIDKIFNLNLQPNFILQYNTIKQQCRFIEESRRTDKDTHASGDFLVPMNSKAERKLFLVHPVGGTTFWYTHLARLLDGKVQIYGIQDPEIFGKTCSFASVQDMAQFYSLFIEKEQPKGSLLLGGASFGGTLAVEIASILSERGRRIDQIFIFDGWAVYPTALKERNYFKSSMERQQKDWIERFNQKESQVDNLKDIFEIQAKRIEMLFAYTPKQVPFNVTLLKAQEIMPIFQAIDAASNHWENYVRNLTTLTAFGNHETMFLPPHVNTLSKQLKKSIDNLFDEVAARQA